MYFMFALFTLFTSEYSVVALEEHTSTEDIEVLSC